MIKYVTLIMIVFIVSCYSGKTINGSGDAEIWSSESLSAIVNGSGDIEYYGDPINVKREVNGSGNISSP